MKINEKQDQIFMSMTTRKGNGSQHKAIKYHNRPHKVIQGHNSTQKNTDCLIKPQYGSQKNTKNHLLQDCLSLNSMTFSVLIGTFLFHLEHFCFI